ncbi:Scramblase-domain-containing protein [Martensiomyces pterosporus]|nr:Scramblase-domain-containing protein [Martensiomyces pterosporus]
MAPSLALGTLARPTAAPSPGHISKLLLPHAATEALQLRHAHVQRGKVPRTAYLRRKEAERKWEEHHHCQQQQQQQQQQQEETWSQPIYIPAPRGRILNETSKSAHLLSQSSLRVTRQLEMMNIFLGFEQANRYALIDPSGNPIGFMLEERTLASEIGRQLFRLHRPFKVAIMDLNGNICFNIDRKFSLINSQIFVSDEHGALIGESQQEWHLWRRRYNLFTVEGQEVDAQRQQFARVDAPFLSWDFPLVGEDERILGGVYRDFAGIGMELFSDYGLYAICFDRLALAQRYGQAAVGQQGQTAIYHPPVADREMDLDERAVTLASAVSIDFDYFSRHSRMGSGGTGLFFFPMFGGGDSYTSGGSDS